MSDIKEAEVYKDNADLDDMDKDELFTEEETPSSTKPVEKDDTPKLSTDEIERYDRLIQVFCFVLYCSNFVGSI